MKKFIIVLFSSLFIFSVNAMAAEHPSGYYCKSRSEGDISFYFRDETFDVDLWLDGFAHGVFNQIVIYQPYEMHKSAFAGGQHIRGTYSASRDNVTVTAPAYWAGEYVYCGFLMQFPYSGN